MPDVQKTVILEVQVFLMELKDVLPDKLPIVLSATRCTDHEIELEAGKKKPPRRRSSRTAAGLAKPARPQKPWAEAPAGLPVPEALPGASVPPQS